MRNAITVTNLEMNHERISRDFLMTEFLICQSENAISESTYNLKSVSILKVSSLPGLPRAIFVRELLISLE
jgi:hypothetical protein